MKKKLPVIPETTNSKLRNLNLQYCLDISYDNDNHNCSCAPDYCRCSVITNIQIKGISDFSGLCKKIQKVLGKNVSLEIISSIIQHQSGFGWLEATSCSGYYGEEIRGAFITSCELIDRLCSLGELDNDNQIRQALLEEYGYLLPNLEDCSFARETFLIANIKPANPNHYQKLSRKKIKDIVENYDFDSDICCIVGPDHRIIDGYHRFKAAEELGLTKVFVYRVINTN